MFLAQTKSSFPLPIGASVRVWGKSRTSAQSFSMSMRYTKISYKPSLHALRFPQFFFHPVKPFVPLNQVFAKNTHLQNYLSVPVGEQRSQCGQPVDIRGQMSSEGSKPSAALPCGDGHWGAAQLLLQTHLQCTETQGEDTHSNTHTPTQTAWSA